MKKENKQFRVIIDTNIWISFLIGKHIQGLLELLDKHIVKVIFSKNQLEELIEVLNRPKFNKYFSKGQIEEFLDLIEEVSEEIEIKSNITICRDPKDNYLLSTAKDGEVDFLITGDEDLLILKVFGNTKIINYKDFTKLIENILINYN